LGGGLAILLGWQTRLTAVVLALFCLATAATVHYVPGNPGQMVNFWKNVTMAGGFLNVVAFGAGTISLDGWRRTNRTPQPA
jgi:putative oxidoreductase